MVEEQGRIVALEDGYVWVETQRQSSCSSCGVREGCGQHLSEKYSNKSALSYIKATVSSDVDESLLKAGASIMVGVPESALLKASFLMYLVPLLLMLFVCWFGSLIGMSEAQLSLSAIVSLMVGFVWVKARSGGSDKLCRVVVTRVLSQSEKQSA